MNASTFVDRAAPIVARGTPVFPCSPDKKPLTPHGLKDASTDTRKLDAWGTAHPDALVAMPTGGQVFVLDVDVDPAKSVDGFATLQANGWEIPATRTHKTRRGGAHFFFRIPDGVTVRNSAGKLGQGVDIRGDGGYVIRWDVHGGEVENPNTVANPPDWLLEALRPRPRNDEATSVHAPTAAISEGGRNAALASLAGSMRAKGLTVEAIEAALLVENATKCAPPLPDDEVRAIARSIGRYEPTTNPSDSEAIARLAALSPLDYDRVRRAEAKQLGVQVSTLDSLVQSARGDKAQEAESVFEAVEPWPDPVSGEDLLSEIAQTIRRFIVCDIETVAATTLWCVASWLADVVNVCPILLINAPEKACGKTQLLTLVGKLVPRPAQAAGISPSVLFRMIEKYRPTLLVDEIETVLTKEAEDLRGLFNAGHTRDSAFVWRSVAVGDDFEPRRFSVYGMKALAGINADRLAETITSRAVVVQLRRKLPGETAQRLRYVEDGLFHTLRSKLARWADDHAGAARLARPELPDELSDRDQDNWEPLLTVADLVGGNWPVWARKSAGRLCARAGETGQSIGATLLADIQNVFETKKVTRISMAELLLELNADDEAPWATWSKGRPMLPRALGAMLGKYGIKSTTMKTGSGVVSKGYKVEQFQDAFNRYLPSSASIPLPPVTQ